MANPVYSIIFCPRNIPLSEQLVMVDIWPRRREDRLIDPVSNRAKGLSLFRKLRRHVLTRQMRAAEDEKFQEVPSQMLPSPKAHDHGG